MIIRFQEENGRLLVLVDPLAIGHSELSDYARTLIAETLLDPGSGLIRDILKIFGHLTGTFL